MRDDVRRALLQRFEACLPPLALHPRVRGYTREPADNLLPALPDADALLADYGAPGGELAGDPPRFCAAESSAALAANSFGPFRARPERLALAGMEGFETVRFERTLSSGIRGRTPRLDLLGSGQDGVVAVEARFTETFRERPSSFSPAWERAVGRLAEPAWAELYRSLQADPHRFRSLDAARLVKHHLSLRHALPSVGRPRVLLYLYWEPSNAEAVPESVLHREEVAALAREVAGSEIRFEALTYRELWDDMLARSTTAEERLHVEALRARYAFPVISSAN